MSTLETPQRSSFAQRGLWALPVGLAVAVRLPALGGERVWDDQVALGDQLSVFTNLTDILFPRVGIAGWTYAYYRPVVTLSYLLDKWLAGPDATFLPHATNILLHAIVTALVWLLAARLFRPARAGRGAALMTAIVFAVHPIHTEAVNWITGRSDVLAALFALPALLLALRWRDRRSAWALALSPVFVLLALLSKETAAAVFLLMPLLYALVPRDDRALPRQPIVAASAIALAYFGSLALYLWLRHTAGIQAGASPGTGPAESVVKLATAVAFYLRKAFMPWPHSNLVSWAMVPGRIGTTLILLAAVTVTAWSFLVYRRTRDAVPAVATCWFWITLAVPLWSAIGMVSRTPLAERHVYLPSIGIALGLAAAWRMVVGRQPRAAATVAWTSTTALATTLATTLAIAVVMVYATGTIRRGFVWQTDLSLWTDAAGQAGDQGLPWLNLGMARLRADDPKGALEAFRNVTATGDDTQLRARAHAAMGTILLRSGEIAEAEASFRAAILLRAESPEPWYGLGAVYNAKARSAGGPPAAETDAADMAIHFLRQALDRNARYYPARLQLASVLVEQGERLERQDGRERAAEFYRMALGELNVLLASFPEAQRAPALVVLSTEVGIDADELRRRIEGHVAAPP